MESNSYAVPSPYKHIGPPLKNRCDEAAQPHLVEQLLRSYIPLVPQNKYFNANNSGLALRDCFVAECRV